MDKELKAKWVAVLRSGKYEQCRNTIHDGKGYCCLGVLADLVGCEVSAEDYSYPSTDVLPMLDQTKLADMNDGKDGRAYSFPELADYIEKHL